MGKLTMDSTIKDVQDLLKKKDGDLIDIVVDLVN